LTLKIHANNILNIENVRNPTEEEIMVSQAVKGFAVALLVAALTIAATAITARADDRATPMATGNPSSFPAAAAPSRHYPAVPQQRGSKS